MTAPKRLVTSNSGRKRIEDRPRGWARIWEKLSAEEKAISITNGFILRSFGDRLSAGKPRLATLAGGQVFCVPILLRKTSEETCEVGEVTVDVLRDKITQSPKKEEVLKRARVVFATCACGGRVNE